MTRSISLAAFFVLILVGVFWFTGMKEVRDRSGEEALMGMLAPRVQVVTPEHGEAPSKFQFAISTDPSSLSQMNREAASVVARVRPAVVLVSMAYQPELAAKTRRKAAPEETKFWVSCGVLVGNGDEVLLVMPPAVTPSDIHVRFQDGAEVKADFIGRDDSSQIALLRLPSAAAVKPLVWRNRRTLEWGEHFYAMGRNPVHGAQMVRVMVSGDAVLPAAGGAGVAQHYRQLDQVLPVDFWGAVLVDGSGQLAGLVVQADAPDDLRALVLDGGAVRVVAEALRSLQKQE